MISCNFSEALNSARSIPESSEVSLNDEHPSSNMIDDIQKSIMKD
jgi:hypothetical protein